MAIILSFSIDEKTGEYTYLSNIEQNNLKQVKWAHHVLELHSNMYKNFLLGKLLDGQENKVENGQTEPTGSKEKNTKK